MKKIIKILLIILIILVAVAAASTFMQKETQPNGQALDEYTTIIGNNSNGTVYKITCGNSSSDDTAIVILGVHSLESGIHNATNETIMNLTKQNLLNKKYVVYFIKLNFNDSGMNTSDYNTNRHMGELLASDYVLPDIEKYNPFVVIDCHEMEDYWDIQRYVGVMENKTTTSLDYAKTIGENLNFTVSTVKGGTSPQWVTMPIYKKGNNVVLFETAQKDTPEQKMQTARELVRTLDSLPVYK